MNLLVESTPTVSRMKTLRQTKKKILLVDDDPGIRHVLFRLLSDENYTVLSAANGLEALELASTSRFDLVLLDLNMPLKDGWDTLEQLTSENPLLPVILITARSNQLFPALASGVGALMEKPLDFTKLFCTIHDLLAESPEVRLARATGKFSRFHHVPPKANESDLHAN
jgi:DNA-binding response OmpR family regulator